MTMHAPRRNLLTFALAGLSAALAVLAFVPPPSGMAPARTAKLAVAPLPAMAMENPVGRAGAPGPAFSRPIFTPSRRLPGGSVSGTGSVAGLKLNAVVLGPGTEKALITGAGAREGQWLTAGDMIDGWRIDEIRSESVILAGTGGSSELALEKPEAAPVRRSRARPRKAVARPAQPGADTKRTQTKEEPE